MTVTKTDIRALLERREKHLAYGAGISEAIEWDRDAARILKEILEGGIQVTFEEVVA